MPRLAPRFYCRARLGVTARHRAGLAGPGSESVASSEIPAVLPLAHGNEERDSRHQAVGTCQSPGPRNAHTLRAGLPVRTIWIANTLHPLGCISSVSALSCDPKAERCPSRQSSRRRGFLWVARLRTILSYAR